jgi:hypothetical protein
MPKHKLLTKDKAIEAITQRLATLPKDPAQRAHDPRQLGLAFPERQRPADLPFGFCHVEGGITSDRA